MIDTKTVRAAADRAEKWSKSPAGLRNTPQEYALFDSAKSLRQCADEIDALKEKLDTAESALLRKGYQKSCDIPACNCGDQWHHGGHAEARLREFREAFDQEGIDRNGKTLLTVLCEVLGDRARKGTR